MTANLATLAPTSTGARTPAEVAAWQRSLFCGHNLTVGRSRVVHVTAWAEWMDGEQLPVPGCHQGFSGHGVHAELRPTARAVSCLRCRRMTGERPDPGPCEPLLLF